MMMHDGDTVYQPDFIITNLQELLAILPDTSASNPKKINFRSKTNVRRSPYNRRVASLPDLESGNSNSSDGSWEPAYFHFFFWPFVVQHQMQDRNQLIQAQQQQKQPSENSLISLLTYILLLFVMESNSESISSNNKIVVIKKSKIIFWYKYEKKKRKRTNITMCKKNGMLNFTIKISFCLCCKERVNTSS